MQRTKHLVNRQLKLLDALDGTRTRAATGNEGDFNEQFCSVPIPSMKRRGYRGESVASDSRHRRSWRSASSIGFIDDSAPR
jgi:hypothetical protein